MPNSPPNTIIRTSHAMALRANGITIGVIQSWNTTQSRGVTHIYEIDPRTSGEPIEAVPGNVGGLTISVNRFDTYTKRMEQAFGTPDFEMLSDQNNPFEVRETWRFPNGAIEARAYLGCWFTQIGRNYSATDARVVNVGGQLAYVRRVRIS